jgi:hypothetical protein
MDNKAMMTWQERIVGDEDILTGKPVIKGTRLAVEFIIDLLAHGWREEEILKITPAWSLGTSAPAFSTVQTPAEKTAAVGSGREDACV